jgi:hypothetical protein
MLTDADPSGLVEKRQREAAARGEGGAEEDGGGRGGGKRSKGINTIKLQPDDAKSGRGKTKSIGSCCGK